MAYSAGIECMENRSPETRTARLVERKEGVVMRRPLVALCALLVLALAGPVMVSAQEATPEAGAGATAVERTDIRYLLPFGPDGLNPALTVAATVEGCAGSPPSSPSIGRMPGTASPPTTRSSTLLRAADAGPGGVGPAGLR